MMPRHRPYVGRFAPSPTGPLHAGSMVAALASWLDARAHGGLWLVRIEDTDTPRCVAGADTAILSQLKAFGLEPDAPPWWQSRRSAAYEAALCRLCAAGWVYPCACTRRDIAQAASPSPRPHQRHAELPYPGTCRHGLSGRPARAIRILAAASPRPLLPAHAELTEPPLQIVWQDRRLGAQHQDVSQTVGDFVLKRADGLWAYQLAVVVDDAAQGVTDVVRGEDLCDNTPRQIHIQRALGLESPRYLHAPLVRGADGEKLSKQTGAHGLEAGDALNVLRFAGRQLDVESPATQVRPWLEDAVGLWRRRWVEQRRVSP